MAPKANDQPTTNMWPTGPPVEPVAVRRFPSGNRGTIPGVAIHKLGRKVAALPINRFLPLADAFVQVKNRLGSFSLAARDLTQRAYGGLLTTAVRVIWLDGTEEAFLLRPVFWQWFDILDVARFGAPPGERMAYVNGPIAFIGQWYFFVGRRRLDRFYSTAAPSKEEGRKKEDRKEEGRKNERIKPQWRSPLHLALPWLEAEYPREELKWKVPNYDKFLVIKGLEHFGKRWTVTSIQTARHELKKQAKKRKR